MTAQPPLNLGAHSGHLTECPDSPNCVSSQTQSESHFLPPIPFSGSTTAAIEKIKQTIASQFPQATLKAEHQSYLHYEFTSPIFRFVDDVEFLVDDSSNQIHFRSASRVGHSDLGANRRRLTKFVKVFNQ